MQIFSLLMQLFMGHIVPCLYFIERENFFLHVYPQLRFFVFFKNLVCVFLFIPTPLFFSKTIFPKTCFVFPIFIGEKFFLPLLFLGGVVALHRGSCLYFLLLCCICFLSTFWLGSLCQYMTTRGRHRWLVCFV